MQQIRAFDSLGPRKLKMRRIIELDALRGLAALAVVLYHLLPHYFFWGWAAVDLFFVLSGYLITSIILRYEGSRGFIVSFYARRSLRIWPIYFLTLFILIIINPLLPRPQANLYQALPYYLTYTQNVWFYAGDAGTPLPLYVHTWSLAIEEQFYLLWPALLLLGGRRYLPLICCLGLAMAVGTRAFGLHQHTLAAHSDGLVLGALLAYVLSRCRLDESGTTSLQVKFGAVGLIGLAYLGWGFAAWGRGRLFAEEGPHWPGLTILAINSVFFALVALVVCNSGCRALWLLRRRPLSYLGTISYGLYLYHWVVLGVISQVWEAYGTGGRRWWIFGLQLFVSLAVAALSWRYIEAPILKLKERFGYAGDRAPSKPTAVEVAQGATNAASSPLPLGAAGVMNM
jgi:peptidoglycan/LPS O-acetylase OafA/YrhL